MQRKDSCFRVTLICCYDIELLTWVWSRCWKS